jgi:hypothetical protein
VTLQEILEEIPRLTTREQLMILQALSSALSASVTDTNAPSAEREAAVDRLYGALRSSGEPPTDDELREQYTDHLSKKYS